MTTDTWQTYELVDDVLSLLILPGIGGRLQDIQFDGQSLLFENPDLTGVLPDLVNPRALPTRSPQFGFPLWGGEKTWIAPDASWPDKGPHPILDSGPYRVLENSGSAIELESQICPLSKLQVNRRIAIKNSSCWTIEHRVTNRGNQNSFIGIWSVAMLRHATAIAVPGCHSTNDVFGDSTGRYAIMDEGLICTCSERAEFKFSTENPRGRVILQAGDPGKACWILCTTKPPQKADTYAHHHPFEIFNSGDYAYCEAEWHSPARNVEPQGYLSFSQVFAVFGSESELQEHLPNDERELVKCMSL